MPLRAIVFDLFDTLVDLELEGLPVVEFRGSRVAGTIRALHREASSRFGLDFETFAGALLETDRDLRKTRLSQGLELPTLERFSELARRLGLRDADFPAALTRIHMAGLSGQVRFIEHHPRVLAALRRRTPLALCSNFSHSPTALQVLDTSGLREHLDVIVVSDAVGIRKPRREIFEETLGRLGVAAEDALHVGDSLSADVGGAARVGMKTAWITRRVREAEGRREAHEGPAPDYQIADLAELEAIADALG